MALASEVEWCRRCSQCAVLKVAAVEVDVGEDFVLHPCSRAFAHPGVLAVVVGELDRVEELVRRRHLQVFSRRPRWELTGPEVVVQHDERRHVAIGVLRALGQVRIVGRGVAGESSGAGVGEVDVEPVVTAIDG